MSFLKLYINCANNFNFFPFVCSICLDVYVCRYVCPGMHLEVRGQLVGFGSLLLAVWVLGIKLRLSGLATNDFLTGPRFPFLSCDLHMCKTHLTYPTLPHSTC